jgi:glycosyltransferase involved in cell wall biosynthesis
VKVTYVVGSLRDGGTERQVLELIRHLDRSQFEPSLVTMEDANLDRADGLVKSRYTMGIPEAGNSNWFGRSLSLAGAVRRASGFFRESRAEIVHAFLPGPSIIGTAAGRLARVPLIIASRRSLASQYRTSSRVAGWADTAAFRLAHFNLGNSLAVSREMVDIGGCPAQKCGTIHNGVDVERFRPNLSSFLRQQMGWSQQEVVFGMVANFRPCKGHRDFVQAAALIAQRHPEARFLMAGADSGEKASIVKQVDNLHLSSRVRVLDSDPSPEKIFAALDIYLCTSHAEGFSNVLLEAMACGKPVIATDVGGNREALHHGESGFLVPAGDPQKLAEVAEQLLLDKALRRTIAMNGRGRVECKFSLQTMVRAHENLYQHLLQKHPQATS